MIIRLKDAMQVFPFNQLLFFFSVSGNIKSKPAPDDRIGGWFQFR